MMVKCTHCGIESDRQPAGDGCHSCGKGSMQRSCEYIRNYYGVPACIGRRVIVNGEPGVIAEDRGHYIGVLFDKDKPGNVMPCNPTWEVEYHGIGKVRKPGRSQARYRRFLEYGDGFESFIDYCRWDAEPERSWNS